MRGSRRGSLAKIASFPEYPDIDDEDAIQQFVNDGQPGVRSTRASSVAAEFADILAVDAATDNSVSVITSLWSTMMGSTVLVMPTMFRDAGLVASCVALVFMCFLCAYTAVTITRLGRLHGMTTKEVVGTLPKIPRNFTLISAVLILVGASMLFHVYIVGCVLALMGKSESDVMERVIVACGTGVIVYVMTIPRSLKLLFLAASYAIIIIGFCLVFIMVKSIVQLKENDCTPKLAQPYGMTVSGFGPVASLMSTLTLSFYSHSFVLPLVSQATRVSKVPRNVFIAYMCAGLSYAIPAAVATWAFSNCGTFANDFVSAFTDPFAEAARCSIILLVMIVYPMVVSIARAQLIETFYGIDALEASKAKHLLISAATVCVITIMPAVNVSATTVAASTGILGTYWALIFPCASYILTRRKAGTADMALYIGNGAIIALGAILIVLTILSVAGVIGGPPDPEVLHVVSSNGTSTPVATNVSTVTERLWAALNAGETLQPPAVWQP